MKDRRTLISLVPDLGFTPPEFSNKEILKCLKTEFNISGQLVPLEGERDQNHLLTSTEGESFVVKISSTQESPQVVEFQIGSLLEIESRNPDLAIPRIIPTRRGKTHCAIGENQNMLRLLSYLEGLPLAVANLSSLPLAHSAGEFLGKLTTALSSYSHPSDHYFLAWELSNGLLDQDEIWSYAGVDIGALESSLRPQITGQILPLLAEQRRQVVHSDAHQHNLLVSGPESETVAGLIDFGDMLNTAVVSDVAIICLGFAEVSSQAERTVASIVAGYHSQFPLLKQELDLVYDLMLAREVLSVLLYDLRIANNPDSSDYVLETRPEMMRGLEKLLNIGADSFRDAIFDQCKL